MDTSVKVEEPQNKYVVIITNTNNHGDPDYYMLKDPTPEQEGMLFTDEIACYMLRREGRVHALNFHEKRKDFQVSSITLGDDGQMEVEMESPYFIKRIYYLIGPHAHAIDSSVWCDPQ